MQSYQELLAKAVKDHPEDYDSYVEKAKRGKVVPFSGRMDFEAVKKKPIPSVYSSFNNKRMYVPPTKACVHCGIKYPKRMRMSFKDWNLQKYCTQRCARLSRKP